MWCYRVRPVLLLWLVEHSFSVSYTFDDVLCRHALETILPKPTFSSNSTRSALVAALVQLDSTYGMTPCEYMKMKGLTLSDAYDPSLKGLYGAVDTSSVGKNVQGFQNASDNAIMGMGRGYQESAAYKAGFTASSDTIKGVETGLNALPALAVKGVDMSVNAIADALSLPHVDLNLEIFKNLDVMNGVKKVGTGIKDVSGIAGKWAYKSGEGIYDVSKAAFGGAFDFFSGVTAGVFPSAAGRRRVVYDVDCDDLEHDIDTIENNCNSYRYNRLMQLAPLVSVATMTNFGTQKNLTALSDQWYGSNTSFASGLTDTFSVNKEALYGKGGDCVSPNKNSIAGVTDDLFDQTFGLVNEISAADDTHWSNIVNLDRMMKDQFGNATETFNNGTKDSLAFVTDSQQELADSYDYRAEQFVNKSNDMLLSFATKIAKSETVFTADLGNATNARSDYYDSSQKQLGNLVDQSDGISNQFADVDGTTQKFVDTLNSNGGMILQSGNSSAAQLAKSGITNAVNTNGQKVIDQFVDQSTGALSQAEAGWKGSMIGYLSDVNQLYRADLAKLGDSNRQLNSSFSLLQGSSDANVTQVGASVGLQLSQANQFVIDGSNSAQQLQQTTGLTRTQLAQLFLALNNSIASSMADGTVQISNVLSSNLQGASEQLSALTNAVGEVRTALGDGQSGLSNYFSQLVTQVRNSVAQKGSANAGVSGGTATVVQSAGQQAGASLTAASDLWEQQMDSAQTEWESSGENALSGLSDAASSLASNSSQFNSDLGSAIAAHNAQVQTESTSIAADAKLKASDSRSQIVTSGTSVNQLSLAAKSNVQGVVDSIGSNQNRVTSLQSSIRSVSDQTDAQTESAATLLSSTTGDVANTFDSSLKSAARDASAQLDKGASAGLAQWTKSSAGANTMIDSVESSIDGTVLHANSVGDGEASFSQNTQNSLANMSNSLGGLIAGGTTLDSTQTLSTAVGDSAAAARNQLSSVTNAAVGSNQRVSDSVASSADDAIGGVAGLMNQANTRTQNSVSQQSNSARSVDANLIQQKSRIVAKTSQIQNVLQNAMGLLTGGSTDTTIDGAVARLNDLFGQMNQTANDGIRNLTDTFNQWNSSAVPSTLTTGIADIVNAVNELGLLSNSVGGVYQSAISGVNADDTTATSATQKILADTASAAASYGSNANASMGDISNNQRAVLGNLTVMAGQVETATQLVGNGNYNSSSSQQSVQSQMTKSAVDLQSMQTQLGSLMTASNASLAVQSGRISSESKFTSDITNSQVGSVVGLGQSATSGAQQLVNDSNEALSQTTNMASYNLTQLQRDFSTFALSLDQRMQDAFSATSNVSSNMSESVQSNRDQLSLQLMLAQRAVKQLLDSWSRYADYETDKFGRMNATDDEFLHIANQKINATSASSASALHSAQSLLTLLSDNSTSTVGDFVEFKNFVAHAINGYSAGLSVLNRTAQNGISQMKESAYNYDANDDFVDKTTRSEMLAAVAQFEKELDARAAEAKQSVGIGN